MSDKPTSAAAPTTDAGVRGLIAKWRGLKIGLSEAMKLTPNALLNQCADELEAALAQQEAGGARVTAEQVRDVLTQAYNELIVGTTYKKPEEAITDFITKGAERVAALVAAAQPPAKEGLAQPARETRGDAT